MIMSLLHACGLSQLLLPQCLLETAEADHPIACNARYGIECDTIMHTRFSQLCSGQQLLAIGEADQPNACNALLSHLTDKLYSGTLGTLLHGQNEHQYLCYV